MPELNELGLFIVAGLLLNLTPGVDMLYVVQRTNRGGFRAGVVAALGIAAGCLFHIALAVVGLSALLNTSATAFSVLKLIGGIYLVYLGFTLLQNEPPTLTPGREASTPDKGWRSLPGGVDQRL